jgi:hypothetical protein
MENNGIFELSFCDLGAVSNETLHDIDKREFVAEASDLKDLVLWRVYEDAADIGFGIKSAKTGKIEYLVETHNQESEEGELLWTEYRAIRGDNGAVEQGWKVVILND